MPAVAVGRIVRRRASDRRGQTADGDRRGRVFLAVIAKVVATVVLAIVKPLVRIAWPLALAFLALAELLLTGALFIQNAAIMIGARKSVVSGKSGSALVILGGRRTITNTTKL